jgi:hypothetical protein
MNKKKLIGIVAGVVVVLVACAAGACKRKEQKGPRPTKWEKMREKMEQMPEDFPPRVMFDNLQATRDNTDEILSLLRERELSQT